LISMLKLFLCYCVTFSSGLSHSKVDLQLHLFELSIYPQLRCNDGSAGGYYYREARTEEDNDKWIFYLEGGGWCWNSTSCNQRIITNLIVGDGHLVSSKNWPQVKSFESGIFTMEGGWDRGHLVYVPYCSSDAHMGDMEMVTGDLGFIQYRGRRLARAAISQLVGKEKMDQTIIFGGTSAGGRGSMVLIDHLQELLHPSTRVFGVHDSGAYQDIPPYDTSYYPFGDQCRDAYNIYQPPISDLCQSTWPQAEDTWKCVCGEYMLPRVMTPSQIIFYLYDSYQLSNDLGTSPKFWTKEMCSYTEDLFRPGMETTVLEIIEAEKHVVFAPACYRHGIMTNDLWTNVSVSGVTAQSQLLGLISGNGSQDVVSTCQGVNCQDTCPELEIGENSYC